MTMRASPERPQAVIDPEKQDQKVESIVKFCQIRTSLIGFEFSLLQVQDLFLHGIFKTFFQVVKMAIGQRSWIKFCFWRKKLPTNMRHFTAVQPSPAQPRKVQSSFQPGNGRSLGPHPLLHSGGCHGPLYCSLQLCWVMVSTCWRPHSHVLLLVPNNRAICRIIILSQIF